MNSEILRTVLCEECNIFMGVCLIWYVYWKLVKVAVNVGTVSCRVCVLETGEGGCKCRHRVL